LFAFAAKQFLFTEDLYYTTFGEQYTSEQIRNVLKNVNTPFNNSIAYFIIPIVIIVRVLYTSFCLYIGTLVEESHWKFKSLFTISLKADVIFCLNSIVNFYYSAFIDDYKTIDDLTTNCSSLLKIVGKENIPVWLVLAFNSISIFELLYVVLLIVLLKISFSISYFKSVVFVLLTYCLGNYFYLTAMTFLYLNFI
jgi:hypothetical protein